MTKQESEALIERLTWIWMPERQGLWTGRNGKFGFSLEIASDLRFECVDDSASFPRDFGLILSLTRFDGELRLGQIYRTGHLYCFSGVGDICIAHSKSRKDHAALEIFQQFVDEWMPYFRRGLWLSGIPIEASAHEKAEWIQGFSREEIEAWNLKI